jgi:hypothetical protein
MNSLGAAFGIVAAIAAIDWLHENSVIDAKIASILAHTRGWVSSTTSRTIARSRPDARIGRRNAISPRTSGTTRCAFNLPRGDRASIRACGGREPPQ